MKKCPDDTPLRHWDYGCVSCDFDKNVIPVKADDCNVCGTTRKMDKGHCVLNKSPDPLRPLVFNDNFQAHLLPCKELMPVKTSKENCDLCPNRTYYDTNGLCALSSCPEDGLISTQLGCVSPNETALLLLDSTDCSKFQDRIIVDDVCIMKEYFFINGYEMYRSGNFALGGLDKIFKAISCTEESDVLTTKESCNLCPNREYKDGWCMLKEVK